MEPPDLVFTGGPVHTADAARSRATAVAVRGERIVAVGHDEVLDLAGPRTEVVDLAGRLLVPGFQDAHVHPVGGGIEMGRCDLGGAVTLEEYRRRIRAYADAHPDVSWITGGGWSLETFPGGTPTRAELDAVVPDRPVYLANRDHHGAWVNTRALELAGITAATADPADGRIERDPGGGPSGTLQEGAMRLVGDLVPAATAEEQLDALLRAQALLHSYGITAWQDAIVGENPLTADGAAAYA
ncbi:amidohydrolase, partial [Actinoallomurus acaciae]